MQVNFLWGVTFLWGTIFTGYYLTYNVHLKFIYETHSKHYVRKLIGNFILTTSTKCHVESC